MAYVTGTATDFVDFYNKLRNFLTTNATLVGLSQNWTQIAGNTGTLTIDDMITLQGPGLAGTDQVRVQLKPEYSVVNGRYNLRLRGVPYWNGATAQDSQYLMSDPVYIHLWNSSMPYTFVANGRRFVAVAQVTSVVEACYAGFFYPYALPTEYPYPMVIGGSSNQVSWLYSQTSIAHSHFVNPSSALKVFHPTNVWVNMMNFSVVSGNSYGWTNGLGSAVSPYVEFSGSSNWKSTQFPALRECFGGDYPLTPLVMGTATPTMARLGVLDGCFHVPGIGNAHGSIVSEGGVDHLVVQNVTRTDNWLGYWALKLE